jgi:hypothetical protein
VAQLPANIGCNNEKCIETSNCQRTVVFKNGTAKEVRHFGGTEVKGCGKFLPKK